MQVDSLVSGGYCFLADTPAATATTAVAAVEMDPAALSVATAAAVRYGNILGHASDCSAITLSQTEFYANKAVGGGGGAIFWDGPVEDLIVICSDLFGEQGGPIFVLLVLLQGVLALTPIHILTLSLASALLSISMLSQKRWTTTPTANTDPDTDPGTDVNPACNTGPHTDTDPNTDPDTGFDHDPNTDIRPSFDTDTHLAYCIIALSDPCACCNMPIVTSLVVIHV